MKNYFIVGIIISIIIYILYKLYYNYIFTIKVKSIIDSKYYRVKNNINKQKSADTFAIINGRVEKLINNLKHVNSNLYNNNIVLLTKRYNPDNLIENIDNHSTSYTLNKGSEVAICISSKNNTNEIHEINRLMFVVIHELSHIGCESQGHNKEFVDFFIYLLKKSIEYKIYKYENYSTNPVEYCGITINNTPI